MWGEGEGLTPTLLLLVGLLVWDADDVAAVVVAVVVLDTEHFGLGLSDDGLV